MLREENIEAGIEFIMLGSLVFAKKLASTDAFPEDAIFFFQIF